MRHFTVFASSQRWIKYKLLHSYHHTFVLLVSSVQDRDGGLVQVRTRDEDLSSTVARAGCFKDGVMILCWELKGAIELLELLVKS